MSDYSAEESMLGYLYQIRMSLLHALQRHQSSVDFAVSIETLDDVVFEGPGSALDLLQLKHRVNRGADLSDSSTDLWKALRNWIESLASVADVTLHMITTGRCATGSAASCLRSGGGRDVSRAAQLLRDAATSSRNQSTAKTRARVLQMGAESLQALLGRVYVHDALPTVDDLQESLLRAIRAGVSREHELAFLESLEGWWLRRAIRQLSLQDGPILGVEIEQQLCDVREQFFRTSLPVDPDVRRAEVDHSAASKKAFVAQLVAAGIGSERIVYAIEDYYRSLQQRSWWVRRDLLFIGDLSDYEDRLVDEWRRFFAAASEELEPQAVEDEKLRMARKVYNWSQGSAPPPIRSGFSEAFFCRGMFHILADDLRVGWHPDYLTRVRQLLGRLL